MRPLNIRSRPLADKAAIGLSALCAVHCLLTPVAVALLPSLAALGLNDESFHIWMVLVVLPISAFALLLGCRAHRRASVLVLGATGLLILGLTPFIGHEVLGEFGERALTLLGASIIAISHLQNYRLCQSPVGGQCQS